MLFCCVMLQANILFGSLHADSGSGRGAERSRVVHSLLLYNSIMRQTLLREVGTGRGSLAIIALGVYACAHSTSSTQDSVNKPTSWRHWDIFRPMRVTCRRAWPAYIACPCTTLAKSGVIGICFRQGVVGYQVFRSLCRSKYLES